MPGLLALTLSIGGTVAWPSPVMNWALVAIGLTVALAVGNIMLIYGAARVAANITSTVLITEIVFAAVTAYLFAGEHIGWQTLTGGLLIVGASVAAAFSTRRPVSALQ